MRLGTLLTDEGPRLVAARDGGTVDLLAADPGLPATLREVLEAGGLEDRLRAAAATGPVEPLDPGRLLPPIPDPGKVLCIGRNYTEHAAETGHTVQESRPEVFLRTRTSLAPPNADVAVPSVSEQLDYEVELAVVIGRRGRRIPAGRAMEHVAGYAVFNDISVRDYQLAREQWTAGKNFDGTGPLGPFLVTADEVPDPHDLELSTTVVCADGSAEELQRSRTSMLVHRIPDLLAYISEWTTLEPGDVIATGTPAGVGLGRNPHRWLRPGETVIVRVEGLGELRNRVVEEALAAGG
jgi:2-keto-4-pentenoate hydratase/2-oxohepta-3-ene-1,7-dioic acid hydratase in catechol pathway